jgi:hypothetical protein
VRSWRYTSLGGGRACHALMGEAPEPAARREVGDQDQVWSLSTAKPGNGVEQLRDGNLDTYWQYAPGALRLRARWNANSVVC